MSVSGGQGKRHSRLLLASMVVTAVTFLGTGASAAAPPITRGAVPQAVDTSPKILFCHATHSTRNPYRKFTIEPASVIRSGHGTHTGPVFDPNGGKKQPKWGDVIPAFDYPAFGQIPAGHFAGLNVTNGQAWLASSCASATPSQPGSAHLTLVKEVRNTHQGSRVNTAWTLLASGPTPISGLTGTTATTSVAVSPGSYNLSESGPTDYDASSWVCTGVANSGSQLTLAAEQTATCTITNSDRATNNLPGDTPGVTPGVTPVVGGEGATSPPTTVPIKLVKGAVVTNAPVAAPNKVTQLAFTGAETVPLGLSGLLTLLLGVGLILVSRRRATD